MLKSLTKQRKARIAGIEDHVAWCPVGQRCTENFAAIWKTENQKLKSHHALQQAIRPGLKSGRAERLNKAASVPTRVLQA